MQSSLLQCVTPNLRQVNAVTSGGKIVINFYYSEVSENESALADEVEAEMWGYYYGEMRIESHIFVLPKAPIPHEGLCVYQRLEENLKYTPQANERIQVENRNLVLSYATQVSLLGQITPNLRAVRIIEDGEKVTLAFYYHSVSKKEEGVPPMVLNKIRPLLQGFEVIVDVVVLPYPSPIPKEGFAAYARFEK